MLSFENMAPATLDAAIDRGLRELEHVARFYEQRGNLEQAAEIRQAVAEMREPVRQRELRNSQGELPLMQGDQPNSQTMKS